MSDVKLTVAAPKELVDVLVALDSVVAKVVAKESVAQLIAEELTTFVQLFGEFQAAVADVTTESDEALDAAELYVRRIVYRLLGKPVAPVVVGM